MNIRFPLLTLSMVVLALPSFANAEVVHTIWQLEPLDNRNEVVSSASKSFFEQRLLPIRMVRTTQSALNGTVPAGTPLYLVYNDARQVGFCTVIDRSINKALKGLFMPVGNKRPCFTDRDGDGRFDATFEVFDLLTSPPKVGGSIANAKPMGEQINFEEIDRHEYPENMKMTFTYYGKAAETLRILAAFKDAGSEVNWIAHRSVQMGDGWVVNILNAQLWIAGVDEDKAKFRIETNADLYLQRVRGGVKLIGLPDFLRVRR